MTIAHTRRVREWLTQSEVAQLASELTGLPAPKRQTVASWAGQGLLTPAGEVVHLRAHRLGGKVRHTRDDLIAFLRALEQLEDLP